MNLVRILLKEMAKLKDVSCESMVWVDCDLGALWVELKQILHFKVGCTDYGPVLDRGSLPYLKMYTYVSREKLLKYHNF